jgi:YidC/Oxa1 family membrane protein insertase
LVDPDSAGGPIAIETPTVRAVLRPHGAAFTSWVLNDFTDAREQPADLVPAAGSGLVRLGLVMDGALVDLGETTFLLESGRPGPQTTAILRARDAAGAEVRVEYQVPGGNAYAANLRVRIEGLPSRQREAFLQLDFADGIAHLERDAKLDKQGGAGVAQIGNRVVKKRPGRGGDEWRQREAGVVHWAGVRSKYFLLALVPKGAPDGEVIMSRVRGQETIATSLRLPLSLEGPTEYEFELYAGPMQYHILQQLHAGLEKSMDLGWKVIVPFTKLLLVFFQGVHRVVPNYGLVIIILSAVVKLIFYPLTRKSMESMRQMQILKPEMDRLNAKYKDDPQRRNQAVLELYRKHKVNPLGGCLPILVQMPVFIALYSVLNTAIELRKAPFALWIHDLSAPDRIGAIQGLPIHILPLIMAGTMVWQQKLTPTDPRQATMAYMMPVIMTVFFYTMPSGLVLYWTVTNLMAVAQQILMNRTIKHQPAAA